VEFVENMNLATPNNDPLGGELITIPNSEIRQRFQIFPKIGHGWTLKVECLADAGSRQGCSDQARC